MKYKQKDNFPVLSISVFYNNQNIALDMKTASEKTIK